KHTENRWNPPPKKGVAIPRGGGQGPAVSAEPGGGAGGGAGACPGGGGGGGGGESQRPLSAPFPVSDAPRQRGLPASEDGAARNRAAGGSRSRLNPEMRQPQRRRP